DGRQRNPWNGIHRGDERLEDNAKAVRTSQDEPDRKSTRHARHKAEERILQRDCRGDPEIVLISRQAFHEITVQPSVDEPHLGFDAAQDQEILENVRWLRDEIGVEQVGYQPGQSYMKIVSPLPD